MPELHVRAVCARNLPDTRTFSTQDPYCKISVRDRTFKTRVDDNGDTTPEWNERFMFETYDPQLDQLHVRVKDKGFTSNTLIGEVYLPVNMFVHGNVVDGWYTLNNEDERAGEINLRIQLVGATPVSYAIPQQQPAGYPVPPLQPQQQYPPQQQQYPAPPQQVYGPQHPLPPPQGYGYPPTAPAAYGAAPSAAYDAAPPAAYGAAPPAVYGTAPPAVVYGGGHSHHGYHGRHGSHGDDSDGGGVAEIALGVGAGVLGGMAVTDILFD